MAPRAGIRRLLTLNLGLTLICLAASTVQATLLSLPSTVTQAQQFTWERDLHLGPPGPGVVIPPIGPLPSINGSLTQPVAPTGADDNVFLRAFGNNSGGVVFGSQARGNGAYKAFSKLHYENVITNTSTTAIGNLVFNFEVAAGGLVVACGGFDPSCDGFASYSIDIRINGTPVTGGQSDAKLAFIAGGTDTQLTKSGFALANEVGPFIGTKWTSFVTHQWDMTAETISLGALAASTSMILTYDLIAEAQGNFPNGSTGRCTPAVPPTIPGVCFAPAQAGTSADIGDPNGLGPVGVGVALLVPEPGTFMLFGIAAAGFSFARRRKAVT